MTPERPHVALNAIHRALLSLATLLVAGFLTSTMAEPARAGHGSWTHHHNAVFESGSSNYGGYANIGASQAYDYGHARFVVSTSQGIIRDNQVTCGPVNEGCGYRKTTTVYWAQVRSNTESRACAYDGSHTLPGVNATPRECTRYGLQTHIHQKSLS